MGSSRGRGDYESALGVAWLGQQGGSSLLRKLREFGAQGVWRASRTTLRSWGVDTGRCERIEEARRRFDVSEARAELRRKGQRFVPFGSSMYPEDLSRLESPPAGLFVRGPVESFERFLLAPRVTVVGTRKPSADGLMAASVFSEALSLRGIAVLSGMALGIDGEAHKASMKTGGLTVAVLGCGADVIYPSSHRWLYEKIVGDGVVVSELPPASRPARWTFPQRNRLLAALCDAVLVVEGAKTSGAMQTASWGLGLGRAVFAVPGSVFRESSEGCNALIYDGAFPALTPETMVEDFLRVTRMERGERQGHRSARAGIGEQLRISEVAAKGTAGYRVVEALAAGPLSVDGLSESTGLSVREVSSALGELEIRGGVERVGPGVFMRAP